MDACRFCEMASQGTPGELINYGSVYAVTDAYPVTSGHWLIIPFRHRGDYFDMTESEIEDTDHALQSLRSRLIRADETITGFNIGWNCGPDAGQTVMHAHAHLIPRRKNDHPNPAGGIRAVIPGKQHYKADTAEPDLA